MIKSIGLGVTPTWAYSLTLLIIYQLYDFGKSYNLTFLSWFYLSWVGEVLILDIWDSWKDELIFYFLILGPGT